MGRRVSEVNLPILAPDLKQWVIRAMEQSTLVEAEVHDLADRWHRLQIRPRRGPGGTTDGAILSLVDIDELRNEVAIAKWARDYARSIVEAVPIPLVVLDVALRVLSANAAYYGLFGEKAAETEGHRFFELCGGEWNRAELQRAVAASLGAAGVFQGLEVVRESPGAPRRVTSVSGCAVASPAGEPTVLLAIEDVTDRRQDEQHRAELLALAEESLRTASRADHAKDLFLADLSHELRTPLTSILLHAQSLQRNHLDAAGVARAAASIEVNTRRQAKLVEDLLDISRITASKLDLTLEEVDWRSLVLGAVDSIRPAAEAKSVQLLATFGAESPHCVGDPARLQQVVANLLDNAVKFTPSNGRVNVRIDAVDGFARLVVSDTGRGIDQAFLPHVFERFAREGSATSHQPGLGLGLAIAHDLVELHGGSVTAESPGKDLGATFTVMLPRKVVPAAGAPGT